MRKWKVLLFALLLGIQTLAIAGLNEGVAAFNAKDYATALREFLPLANQGNAPAQYNLGLMYEGGRGVPKDEAQAVAWFRKAAEQGNATAQYNLGVMYDNGRGVPKEEAQAVAWYRKAAEQGNAMAQTNLGLMYFIGRGVQKDVVLTYMLYNIAAASGKEKAINNRASLEGTLSRQQITEAQAFSSAWKPGTPFPTTSRTGKLSNSYR